MKIIIVLLITLGIIPVSIMAMMWGWGLEPVNWGWIAFGYLWMIVAPLLIKLMEEI